MVPLQPDSTPPSGGFPEEIGTLPRLQAPPHPFAVEERWCPEEALEPGLSPGAESPAPEAPWRAALPLPGVQARRLMAYLAGAVKVAALVVLVYTFLFNFSVVRGSSMAPGIHDGDRILIDHVSYLFGRVERGDVVVLKYPLDPGVDYIKRVIGLPGDQIRMAGGRVWVNGVEIEEPYVSSSDPFTSLCRRVKPAHFFVLGDNRTRSSDSREFGQVPQDYVRGKVEVRVWPPGRIGLIQ